MVGPDVNADGVGGLQRLRRFVLDFGALIDRSASESALLAEGGELLRSLVATDDWLPAEFAAADAAGYRQYLLHCDSRERFCVVSFVWGPGQATPVHDHRVWGIIGMLRGAERAERFVRPRAGGLEADGEPIILRPGEIDVVSPRVGDIHRVSNALPDRPSISIHVYGANIGAVSRSIYDDRGQRHPFVSGYSNATLPNLWCPPPA